MMIVFYLVSSLNWLNTSFSFVQYFCSKRLIKLRNIVTSAREVGSSLKLMVKVHASSTLERAKWIKQRQFVESMELNCLCPKVRRKTQSCSVIIDSTQVHIQGMRLKELFIVLRILKHI